MNRTNPGTILLIASFLLVPPASAALKYCETSVTEKDCDEAVAAELLKSTKTAERLTGDAAAQAIVDMQPALDSDAAHELLKKIAPEVASLPGASPAFEDFLARLKIGVSAEGIDEMQALAFDLTDFLRLPIKSGYKLQATAEAPTLFEALSKKLSAEDREKRNSELGNFDDLLVTLSYSPSTTRLGKNIGASEILIAALLEKFIEKNKNLQAAATEAKNQREALMKRLPEEFFGDEEGLIFDKLPETRRMQAREAVEQAAVSEAYRLAALSKGLYQGEFFKVGELVANQPQLVVKATRSVRDELVGPEETTLKVSYEMGFINMNSLRRSLDKCSADAATCFTSYLTTHRAALAKDGYRLTFSLDWTKREDYRLSIDSVNLDVPGRDRWCASTTYGRNLRVDENGKFTSRVDLTASWQDWSDDPMYQDRALANLSLTQKVNDDFSLVLGAVWASKPEFRGQVDKEVSARFGLTYRFLDKQGKEIMKAK